MAAALAADSTRTALLVVADGSASRTEKAPASLHPDAEAFDREVAAALGLRRSRAARRGRPRSSGGRVERRLARVARRRPSGSAGTAYAAELHADEAPYGVGYLAASWIR